MDALSVNVSVKAALMSEYLQQEVIKAKSFMFISLPRLAAASLPQRVFIVQTVNSQIRAGIQIIRAGTNR